jgi:hypothetical protein
MFRLLGLLQMIFAVNLAPQNIATMTQITLTSLLRPASRTKPQIGSAQRQTPNSLTPKDFSLTELFPRMAWNIPSVIMRMESIQTRMITEFAKGPRLLSASPILMKRVIAMPKTMLVIANMMPARRGVLFKICSLKVDQDCVKGRLTIL